MNIQILMSTYNGEMYLRTQLDSIVHQTLQPDSLLIRDDGSTDRTLEILEEYSREYSWISYYSGLNQGVQRSYFDLIARSDEKAQYFAFADQDDEWMPDKLKHAVKCLTGMGNDEREPALYCGAQNLVDEKLEPLHVTTGWIVKRPSFGNALVQNICTGCTAVVNRVLMDLVKENLPMMPQRVIMHDWWLYLAAECFGKTYYDANAYISYRQHSGNAAGAMITRRDILKYRLGQLRKRRGEIYEQVEEFYECFYERLNEQENFERAEAIRRLLKSQTSFWERLKVVRSRYYYRQKLTDDIVFRAIVLIGKL